MKNKTIILIFGMIMLLGVINSIFAADGYCFVRLGNGQSIPSEITSSTKHMTCDGTKCMVHGLLSDSSFLQVCTDSRGYYASYTNCGSICANNGHTNSTFTNLTLVANFPFANGGVFTKQTFFMDILTNKISFISLIDNIAGTQRTLCPNCVSYNKVMSFKQGFNDVTIRAVKGDEIMEKRVTFFIDNLKPRITKTMPLQNKFANGDFIVNYDEANIKIIELKYGTGGNIVTQNSTVCPNGKSQSCMINGDLTAYDGMEIEYWFIISDVANNMVSSKKTKVFVDKTMPSINSLNYVVKGAYVTFTLNINEKNMDKVYYYLDEDSKQKILCTGLNKGICSKRIGFRSGHHVMDIQVRDKAGNVVSRVIEFDV